MVRSARQGRTQLPMANKRVNVRAVLMVTKRNLNASQLRRERYGKDLGAFSLLGRRGWGNSPITLYFGCLYDGFGDKDIEVHRQNETHGPAYRMT